MFDIDSWLGIIYSIPAFGSLFENLWKLYDSDLTLGNLNELLNELKN